MDITNDAFEALVEEALGELPEQLIEGLDNVIFVVEDEPEDGSDTLGYYDGTALTERDSYGYGQLPDRIVLFSGPLSRMCGSEDNRARRFRGLAGSFPKVEIFPLRSFAPPLIRRPTQAA